MVEEVTTDRTRLWPLILITPVVAVVLLFPAAAMAPLRWEMASYALFVAAYAAAGAAVIGVPFAAAALRLRWRRWWQALFVGAAAAAVSPAVGIIALAIFRRPGGSLISVLQGAVQSVAGTAQMMPAIGAAAGMAYWGICVAKPSRWITAVLAVATLTAAEAGVFAYRSRQSADRARAMREYHRDHTPPGNQAEMFSVRMTRAMTSEAGAALFVQVANPQCGLMFRSPAIAEHFPVGTEVWTDITEFRGGGFGVVKVGDVTDRDQLLKVDVWRCKPWR